MEEIKVFIFLVSIVTMIYWCRWAGKDMYRWCKLLPILFLTIHILIYSAYFSYVRETGITHRIGIFLLSWAEKIIAHTIVTSGVYGIMFFVRDCLKQKDHYLSRGLECFRYHFQVQTENKK